MRLKALKVIYLFTLVVIVLRLYYWQVIKFDDLTALAEQQHLVNYSLDAPRGVIYSSDGSILASNQPSYLLFAQPKLVEKKDEVATKLANLIASQNITPQDTILDVRATSKDLKANFFDKLTQDLDWVALSKNLPYQTRVEIDQLGIRGLGFDDNVLRWYPEASMAAHVLGFVGSNSLGFQAGYFGVEGYYDRELQGVLGNVVEEKDAQGLPILMGKFLKKDPVSGSDLVLNIDRSVQHIVEKELKQGVEKYGAKSGSVLVMNPKTGAVVSMAAFPNYDANHFVDFPKENFKNPNVADSYEPGSTFKVLVMAAAINESLVKPDTKCDSCSEPVELSGYTIKTWDNKYFPNSTMSDVIVHSDNTGMVFVGKKLGKEKILKYFQDFGFGSLTGVDLQDETSPNLRPASGWGELDLATATFGQGIAVTPLQMVRAVATIANQGYLMEPHVVSQIKDSSRTINIAPKVVGQPISPETAKTVTQMMVDAVDNGESKSFKPQGYKIAGKTGTAQIVVTGHYDPNKTIASFIGFAPADDPKFIMLVLYDQPSASIFGAETAAPTFFAIAKQLFDYYNIPPS